MASRDGSGQITPFTGFVSSIVPDANVDVLAPLSVASNQTISSLRFNSAASSAINIASGATLTLDGILITSAAQGSNIQVTGGQLVGRGAELIIHNYDTTGTFQIDSAIKTYFGVTMTGPGTLVLRGPNDYHWATTINGGTLNVAADNHLGSSFDTDLKLNGGTLQLGGSFPLAGNRLIKLGIEGGTIDTNGFDLTFSGVGSISGEGGLTKRGDGTFFMRNNSAYAGLTRVKQGTLVISAGGLGTVDNGTLVESGASLAFEDTFYNMPEPLVLNGDGAAGGGALQNLSGTTSFAGPVTLQSDSRIMTRSGRLELAGGISGTARLTKRGAGILALGSNNSYTGGTTLDEGLLFLSSDRSLGAAPATATVNLTANGGSICSASEAIALHANRTILLTSTGSSAAYFGPNSGTITVNGKISGPGTLVRNNPSGLVPLVLANGENDYTGGTIVSAGVLQFNTPGAIGGREANVLVGAAGIVTTGYPLDQAMLARIDPFSNGVISLSADSDSDLNFGAAGLEAVTFGATRDSSYGGALTPADSTYQLGGGGGTLTLTRAGVLKSGTTVRIGRGNSSDGSVVLTNDNDPSNVVVAGGSLQVRGAALNCSSAKVLSGATLQLDRGAVTTNRIEIEPGGSLHGCGTVNGEIVNNGTIELTCDAVLNGPIMNNGKVIVHSSAAVLGTGSFINNGTVDLLTSPKAVLPSGFVNNGTVIDSSAFRIQSIARQSNFLRISVTAYSGHTYQLQRRARLDPGANWQNVGTALAAPANPQFGMTFYEYISDKEATFYRILAGP